MAASERADLSPLAEQRIVDVVRSLMDDQVDRGVELGRPMHCDSCDSDKSPMGSTQYGAYALCNDCLLEFTLLLARGDIENVAEYMTKRPESTDSPPASPPERMESRPVRSVSKRGEKLLPSNEPC